MNAKHNVKSEIEQQLDTIVLTQRQRYAALEDARIAEAFAEACMWVVSKFSRLTTNVFVKPSLKY